MGRKNVYITSKENANKLIIIYLNILHYQSKIVTNYLGFNSNQTCLNRIFQHIYPTSQYKGSVLYLDLAKHWHLLVHFTILLETATIKYYKFILWDLMKVYYFCTE